MPKTAELWSLSSLREKPIKIAAKIVRHGRLCRVSNGPRSGCRRRCSPDILSLIARLRVPPSPT
jgi:hypothetical protein